MNYIIYLDLDGTILDFNVPAMRYHEAPINFDSEYPKNYEWNIVGATNHLRETIGLSPLNDSEFWDVLGHEFYYNLKFYPGALDFISKLEELGNVHLATNFILTPGCASGKVQWIMDNMPDYIRSVFIGPRKEQLSQRGRILIDDREETCNSFEYDERGIPRGGSSILVPRPWNSGGFRDVSPTRYYDDIIDEVKDIIRWN